MAGRYAQELANQGFATLAFDFRYFGESGGELRQYESASAKVQDFKNAISFLQVLPFIDPDLIGGLAVCASAQYMARAIAEDHRFRSFVTVAGWFQHPDTTPMFYGGSEGVQHRIDLANAALSQYRQTRQMDYVPAYDPNNLNAAMFFEVNYYADPNRGAIPQWKNQFAVASWLEWLQLNGIDSIAEKITVPLLQIHSDTCVLPNNLRRFHESVQAPKALH
jgi:pimeloyl-ACP methyl ester carboxylesterase